MEQSFNFKLDETKPYSAFCINEGFKDFESISAYLKSLPYGRNSDTSNFKLVITEKKGTCASKHAFLKEIAIENNQDTVKLFVGVHKMTHKNTPGIDPLLTKYKLDYLPQAHTYLKINGELLDVTSSVVPESNFMEDLIFEEEIIPNQVLSYKREMHQNYLKEWIKKEKIDYTFDEIWSIREEGIAILS